LFLLEKVKQIFIKRKTTQEIMDKLTERLMIKLEKGEILCPHCKGLRFVFEVNNDGQTGYIASCNKCYNGKLYTCEHCNKHNKIDHCNCEKASEIRFAKLTDADFKKDQELFAKAQKINFNDYIKETDVKYFLINDSYASTSDDVIDWVYELIKDGEEAPKYLWATKAESMIDLNIHEIIYDKCEDGYEDMYTHLDTDNEELIKAQEHLDTWYNAQGDQVNCYVEDYTLAILLDDLIKETIDYINKKEE
jgi:hypothetical protein